MKTISKAVITLVLGGLLVGCNIAGPAYPEKNGRHYLESHGYPSLFADRVVYGEKLDHSEVLELSKCGSTDVRFLVASNPNLTPEEIYLFIRDKDDFTRSGAACNTKLSPRQIDFLTNDRSHTVYSKLAENTALSESALLRIHKRRNPGLVWFASNPNCPGSIRKEIVSSGDSLARDRLKITDGWKKDGIYQRNTNGRWYKPQTRKTSRTSDKPPSRY